jgi:hypothetical protein
MKTPARRWAAAAYRGGGYTTMKTHARRWAAAAYRGGGELAGTREHTLPEARARGALGRHARGGGRRRASVPLADCDGGCDSAS